MLSLSSNFFQFILVSSLLAPSSCSDPQQQSVGDECQDSLCPPPPPTPPSSDRFSRLKLNIRELYGSRWALEQKQQISISHAIDIVDATLLHTNQLTLRVEFNLRQSWAAPQLELPPGLFHDHDPGNTFISASDKVLANMWCPDSYISTTRESNMNTVGTPLSLVYIFKNRTIIFKVRMWTKVGCTSSFQWYPLDVQYCDLVIESYKYQDDIVSYHWTDPSLYRPVMIQIGRLFQYELRLPVEHDNGTFERGGRGKLYPFVRVRFTFERKLGNNLIQVYTPTFLVTILSWFSFWLGLDAIPGRISLLVTCMLTLVTMHSGIKTSIPPVHYITMMDLWMVFSMGMVFSAMCEFIVVKYLHWRHQQQKKEAKFTTNTTPVMEREENDLLKRATKLFLDWEGDHLHPPPISVTGGKDPAEILRSILVETGQQGQEGQGHPEGLQIWKPRPLWISVDRICRFLFPFLFSIFNLIYWPVLLYGSGDIKT